MSRLPTKRRRGAALSAGVLVLAVAGCSTTVSPRPAPADTVVLVAVPGGVAASSLRHGPFREEAGRSWGFSHDELGAALAASHIGPRLTATAGPEVTESILVEQCWGDIDAVRARRAVTPPLSDRRPSSDLDPTAFYFRVIAGDGNGAQVVVSLLAETAQARARGGYSRVDVTLRRFEGDWQLRVPVQVPQLHLDRSRYELLGPTP